jgi:hypothetical protein
VKKQTGTFGVEKDGRNRRMQLYINEVLLVSLLPCFDACRVGSMGAFKNFKFHPGFPPLPRGVSPRNVVNREPCRSVNVRGTVFRSPYGGRR